MGVQYEVILIIYNNTWYCLWYKQAKNYQGIVDKINLAIAQLYKPKGWDKDDKDLATLVLRIGGPALLQAFHAQNKLPSCSFVNKLLSSEVRICHFYDQPIEYTINHNIMQFVSEQNGFFSIKMDELALTPRASWNTQTNEIVGFCENHKDQVNG